MLDMDFCDDFTQIKAVLDYCNDYLKPLNKINYYGGNEDVIEEVISRLLKKLIEKGYVYKANDATFQIIPGHRNELRKIAFFLALNTETIFKYNLSQDNQICHVLDITPKFTKVLFVHMIWGLNLEGFFFEIIKYTPSWFALEFIWPAISFIKNLKPYNILTTAQGLLEAIFENLCRLEQRQIDARDKTIIFEKYYEYVIEILQRYCKPSIETFKERSKLKFYKYQGYVLRRLLDTILFCFNAFEYPLQKVTNEKYIIYEICTNLCPRAQTISSNVLYSNELKSVQLKVIQALLDSLQYNLLQVEVSTFMHWVEIDLPASENLSDLNDNDTNLQVVVGERAYLVNERISQNPCFAHECQQPLKSISISPKTFAEVLKEATIGDILRRLDNNVVMSSEKRKIWFDELLNRSLVFGNQECIETISANMKMITVNHCKKMLDFLASEIERLQNDNDSMQHDDDDDDNEEVFIDMYDELILLLRKSLQNFTIDELIEIVLYRIKLFGQAKHDKFAIQDLYRDDNDGFYISFRDSYIEFFNKCSTEKTFNIFKFLQLCFENPEVIWKKFFSDACSSDQQLKNFIFVAKQTKKLSLLFIEQLVHEFFPSKCNQKLYVRFIFDLYQENLLDRQRFLKEFIYKNVTELLEMQEYEHLVKIFKILHLIVSKSELPLYAPVLVMAGQVIDKLRWDILTYSDIKEDVVKSCIDFMKVGIKKFLPIATERDKSWINGKIKSYRPITQYYFQKFTLKLGEEQKHFDKFLHPNDFVDRTDIDEFLTSTFVRCTTKETEWLARNEKLLPHISDVILILDGIICEMNNENAISNYRYCILNYVNILNKFLLPKVTQDKTFAKDLVFKILKIIEAAPDGIYDEIFMIFYEILFEIFQKCNQLVTDGPIVKDVKKFVAQMKDCKGKELFDEKFSAMTLEISD